MSVAEAPAPTAGQQTIDGGEVVPQDGPLDEIRVTGTTALGIWSAGGKAPTSSTLKLKGGTFALLDGQAFEKGQTLVLQVVVVLEEAAQKDKRDKATQIVMSCEQTHGGYISDLKVIDHS